MNIGINLLALTPTVSGGIEFYIRNLLASLSALDTKNHYYLLTNADNDHTFEFTHTNFHRVMIHCRARPPMRRIVWEQIGIPVLAKRLSLDVLHSPSYTVPVFSHIPAVVTICDMLYKILPRSIKGSKRAFWRLLVPLSARRCRKVLTLSESSKQDIVKYLRLPSDKVIVTPLAVDRTLLESSTYPSPQHMADVCRRHRIRQPYILSVGCLGNHKNALSLVKGLSILRRRPLTETLTLVLTGHDYGAKRHIESASASLGLRESVCLPGYVPREDLGALYSGALAYVSSSYCEGFGLTLLEAMAYHTPIVASDRASLPEVAGNAALFVGPDHPHQLADAVYQLASDSHLRAEMIGRGALRVTQFSWERTARLTLAAYQQTVVGSDAVPS